MTGRGSTAAFQAEIAKALNRPVHLLEVDFDPYIYLTDAGLNITWNGHVYLASPFLNFSTISETSELLVNSCTIALSGVDQQVVALLLLENYLNRRAKIRTAMLDADLQVVADPVLIFDGRMDRPSISVDPDNGKVTCTVEGVSHWTDFERRPGRHSNNVEQQKFFPGDLGFAGVPTIPEEIFWGVNQVIGTPGDTYGNPRRRRRKRNPFRP